MYVTKWSQTVCFSMFLCLTLIVNLSPWLQLELLNPQNTSTGRSLSVYLLLSVPVVLAYLLNLLLLRLRLMDFTGGSDGKESACNAGDPGSILGSGKSPGEGNGNPLQYSYLESSMDRGAWRATVHGVAKSRAQLSD